MDMAKIKVAFWLTYDCGEFYETIDRNSEALSIQFQVLANVDQLPREFIEHPYSEAGEQLVLDHLRNHYSKYLEEEDHGYDADIESVYETAIFDRLIRFVRDAAPFFL